jgi:cyclopropane-fatty-acyl-phospholipid synthase
MMITDHLNLTGTTPLLGGAEFVDLTDAYSARWRERFLAHREDVERIYEPRFVRMWEFYLAASEMSFREQNMMVTQIQLTRRQGVVPVTRDYITSEEHRLAVAESKRRPPLRLAGE